MRVIAFIAMGLVSIPFVQADDRDADELELFIGHWSITKMIEEGTEFSEKDLKNVEIEFTETTMIFTMTAEDDHEEYKFHIDMASSPRSIDLIDGEGKNADIIQGIYKIEGEKITICVSSDDDHKRPTKFESKSGSDTALIELKLKK